MKICLRLLKIAWLFPERAIEKFLAFKLSNKKTFYLVVIIAIAIELLAFGNYKINAGWYQNTFQSTENLMNSVFWVDLRNIFIVSIRNIVSIYFLSLFLAIFIKATTKYSYKEILKIGIFWNVIVLIFQFISFIFSIINTVLTLTTTKSTMTILFIITIFVALTTIKVVKYITNWSWWKTTLVVGIVHFSTAFVNQTFDKTISIILHIIK